MNFYLIFTIAIGFVLICRWKGKGMGFSLFLLLFFLAAFRGEYVGHDTVKYLNIAYIRNWAAEADISTFTFDNLGSKVELISGLMFKTIVELNLDTRFSLVFYAFIMMFFLYLSCRRFKVSTAYAIAFFVIFGFFFYSMSAIRQFCAITVILYAMSFLQEKSTKKYLFFVWMTVSVFIHSFSIICFPLYFIIFLPKYNKKIGWIIWVLSLFVVLVRIDFLSTLSVLLEVDRVSDYMTTYGDVQSFSVQRILSYWIEITCLFYFFYRKKKLDCLNYDNHCFMVKNADEKQTYQLYAIDYMYLFSIFFYALLFSYDGLIGRARYNICIIQCVYLASYFMYKPLKYVNFDIFFFMLLLLLRIAKNRVFMESLESNYYLFF